jgi:hypothetical protein
VPSHVASRSTPNRARTRSPISPAARLVKVNARMRRGSMPRSSIRCKIRSTITRVLPEPAPANTNTGPSGACTAAH